jgi:hypothetical protein
VKFTELEPRWVGLNGWALPEVPFYIGVNFLCPCCRSARMYVVFDKAIDPTNVASDPVCGFDWPPKATAGAYAPERLCGRDGDTFETLTLKPPMGVLEFSSSQAIAGSPSRTAR